MTTASPGMTIGGPSLASGIRCCRFGLGLRAQVDGQGEHASIQVRHRVTDDGVVLEIETGLIKEPLALSALQGGQAALANGTGPGLEPLDHGVGIEVLGDG
jgi:hypothetical protein